MAVNIAIGVLVYVHLQVGMVYMSIAKYIHSQVDNDGEYIAIGVYVHRRWEWLCVAMRCMSTHKWEWYTCALPAIICTLASGNDIHLHL